MNTSIKLSFLFLLASCQSLHKDKNSSFEEINTNESRIERQFSDAMKNITLKLNLPDLKNGVDSFEMRIWCPVAPYKQNLIVIRYIKTEWEISETYIWESYPEREVKRNDTANHLLEVSVDSTKSNQIIPKINNEKFIDTLLSKFAFDFPKLSDFAGSFEIGTDGYRFIFEIAEKNKYQLLSYDCGGSITGKQEFHDKMRKFLDFIKRHLQNDMPNCN